MSNFSWKLFVGPVALIAILAIGYPVFWHVAATRLERAVLSWVDARRGDGWDVEHGKLKTGGFPFELRITVPRPTVTATPDGWRWQGRQVVLAFQPWDWRRIRVEAHGRQSWAVRVGGVWRRFDANAARSAFVGRIGAHGGLSEGMIDFSDLAVAGPDNARLFAVRAMRVRFHRTGTAGGTAAVTQRIALRLTQAKLSKRYRLPLGQTVARLDLDAAIHGGLPRLSGPASVETWRRGGGAVDISGSDLHWGPARARVTGHVTLDEAMRPDGALQVKLQGYDETLAVLEGAGMFRPRDAATARIALRLLARPGPDGHKVVLLPVSAQAGALYLGPLRVLKLRPISFWAPSARTSPPGASR